jgi:hypothetical protein
MYSVAYKILLRDMQFFEDTTCQEDKQQDKLIKKRYGYSNTSFNWGEFNNIQELKFKMDEIYNKVRYKMLSLVSLQNENDDEIITERKLLKCFEEFGTNEYIDKYKYVLNMMEGVSFNKFYFLNHIEFISKPEYFDNLPLWLKVMYLYNIYHLLYKFKQEDDNYTQVFYFSLKFYKQGCLNGYYILPKAIIFCQRLLYFAKGYYILPKAIIFCQRLLYFANIVNLNHIG